MTAWVFAEEVDGAPSDTSLELLAKARTHDNVTVFYVGAGSDSAWAPLGEHGASKVQHLDPGGSVPAAGAAASMADLLEDGDAEVVFASHHPVEGVERHPDEEHHGEGEERP